MHVFALRQLEAFKQRFMVLRQVRGHSNSNSNNSHHHNGHSRGSQSNSNSNSPTQSNADSAKQYECVYCKMKFLRAKPYELHTENHLRARPFECRFCMKRFQEEGELKQHTQKSHLSINLI